MTVTAKQHRQDRQAFITMWVKEHMGVYTVGNAKRLARMA